MNGHRVIVTALSCAVIMSCTASASNAQTSLTPDVLKRLDAVDESIRALSARINDLATMLKPVLPAPPVASISDMELDVRGAAMRGNATAQIAILEFTDFQCPFCARHAQIAYPDILKHFVDSGKIQYIVRNLPLEALHSLALKAAQAAECAGNQDAYWEMHDRLFANQQALEPEDLQKYARMLKLNVEQFNNCLAGEEVSLKVKRDLTEAERLGLVGTPVFLIGQLQPNGKLQVTHRIDGSQPFPLFKETIEKALANNVKVGP